MAIDLLGPGIGKVPPNYAFERPGLPSARAAVRPSQPLPPAARLRPAQPAAQCEG
jgi:hypothetical protein